MNARQPSRGYESNEEVMRFQLSSHGGERSLSTLWQLFNPAPVPQPAELFVNDDFLQNRK